jgi:hypothetical protein
LRQPQPQNQHQGQRQRQLVLGSALPPKLMVQQWLALVQAQTLQHHWLV